MKPLLKLWVCFVFFVCCFVHLPCVEGKDEPKIGISEIEASKKIHEEKQKRNPAVSSKLPTYFDPVIDAQDAPLQGLADGSRDAQEKQRQTVHRTAYPLEVKTKKTGIHFRLLPAGTFMMGSPLSESGRDKDEGTLHKVTISTPIYVSKYEITQGQWEAVMGNNPSRFKGSGKDAPVETVSWSDCQEFCFMLSQKEEAPPHVFRLPTEAQWEYACRAGTISPYVGDIHFLGWYDENSGAKTHPVGLKSANAWGLFDMQGNVYEWCQDWYRDSYLLEDAKDPTGSQSGEYRVLRGGSWFNNASYFRSANRGRYSAGHRREIIGFRLVVFPGQ